DRGSERNMYGERFSRLQGRTSSAAESSRLPRSSQLSARRVGGIDAVAGEKSPHVGLFRIELERLPPQRDGARTLVTDFEQQRRERLAGERRRREVDRSLVCVDGLRIRF